MAATTIGPLAAGSTDWIESVKRQLHQPSVKSRAWPPRVQLRDESARDPKGQEPSRYIYPVSLSERFHQRLRRAAIRGDLVVLQNHRLDFRHQFRCAGAKQVRLRQRHRRTQVVERAGGPDSEIVKGGGDRDAVQSSALADTSRTHRFTTR